MSRLLDKTPQLNRSITYRRPLGRNMKSRNNTRWRGFAEIGQPIIHYRGKTGDNSSHQHAAIQIVAASSIAVEVEVNEKGKLSYSKYLFIKPNVSHRLLPLEAADIWLVEPASPIGRQLLKALPNQDIGTLDSLPTCLAEQSGVLFDLELDPRLRKVMAELSGPEALQKSIDRTARKIGISPARLRHLSKQQMGMSISVWRRWFSLKSALRALGSGTSIADAAHTAGFSDQAHLTRVARSTLGVSPGKLIRIKNKRFIQ